MSVRDVAEYTGHSGEYIRSLDYALLPEIEQRGPFVYRWYRREIIETWVRHRDERLTRREVKRAVREPRNRRRRK